MFYNMMCFKVHGDRYIIGYMLNGYIELHCEVSTL